MSEWLTAFERSHGRPPRLLHIGNVANNAYLNAKILNRAGLHNDVLCYDYYHIMSCPEWEDADYSGHHGHDFYPAWEQVDLGDFQRPSWFLQGPVDACLAWLLLRNRGAAASQQARRRLEAARREDCRLLREPSSLASQLLHLKKRALRKGKALLRKAPDWVRDRLQPEASFQSHVDALSAKFRTAFPERPDGLTAVDVGFIRRAFRRWKMLLSGYDAVIGYSTDGVYPLLCGSTPYLAYEHGTIRHIPFQQTAQGRLCALTYRCADWAFVTNADNVRAADKLGLSRFGFVPHPVNEDWRSQPPAAHLRASLLQGRPCDFLLFHPSRQHWTSERHPDWEKGNDVLIRGFARFCREICPNAQALLVDWGLTVAASRLLIEECGISGNVIWIAPQPSRRMSAWIQVSDALADQFFLGAFGSTTPKGLMLGCPTLLHLDPAIHRWCFPELPPVLNCRSDEDVFAALTKLYREPGFARDLATRGRSWYDRYHSNRVIAETMLEAFGRVCCRPAEQAA